MRRCLSARAAARNGPHHVIRLVYIATAPVTAFRLMDGQLSYFQRRGFDVTVITAPGALLSRTAEREGVRAIGVPMSRELSPGADVVALARLTRELGRLQPTIVNAGTPKAGLLGVMAARLARVPVVIYLLRGLRFEGTTGMRRLLLAATEHVSGGLADRVFVNSESLKARFSALGCAEPRKLWVPGHGSSNGVEPERFTPSESTRAWARRERAKRGIPDSACVVGFVGRFVKDKGLVELVEAFRAACETEPALRLLLVGDHDATDPLPAEVRRFIAEDPRVVTTGFVDEPASYYALMDFFAFPSAREGFPNAVLEASAAELPVVAFKATGTVDAVVQDVTGSLLDQGDIRGLTRELVRYARDRELCERHGRAGRDRTVSLFRREVVWQALEHEYRRLAAPWVR